MIFGATFNRSTIKAFIPRRSSFQMRNKKLRLPTVTLCCVETSHLQQALYALRQCTMHVEFGRVLLISTPSAAQYLEKNEPIELSTIQILENADAHTEFILKSLHGYIKTDHTLLIQWDGFITNPLHWRPDYLKWDYIGAPWFTQGGPGYVGNGGFSLRSRKLLIATPHISSLPSEPEDMTICVHQFYALHTQHDIQIAPVEVAKHFSTCDDANINHTFGFHGARNFAHFMPTNELRKWLIAAPAQIIASKKIRELVKVLICLRRYSEALALIQLRRRYLGRTRDHYSLKTRVLIRKIGGIFVDH